MNMKGGFVGSGQGIMRRLTCIQSHDKSLHLFFVTAFSFCSFYTFRSLGSDAGAGEMCVRSGDIIPPIILTSPQF